MPYALTDLDKVKQLTGLNAGELSDAEIDQYILDTMDDIYDSFGRPIKKIYTYIENGEYSYVVDKQKRKIFSVESLYVNGSLISTGSYSVDKNIGEVTLGSSIVNTNVSKKLEIEYVPKIFESFATFRASQKCLMTLYITGQDGTTSPRLDFINSELKALSSKLSPANKGLLRSSKYEDFDPRDGEYIDQRFYI